LFDDIATSEGFGGRDAPAERVSRVQLLEHLADLPHEIERLVEGEDEITC
jgi:hypothetical protein